MQTAYAWLGVAGYCIQCTSLQCILDDAVVFRKMQHIMCANPDT